MNPESLLSAKTLKGYEVQSLVAEGGQGQIYRAYQPILEREVAIKVIRAEYANHPDFIRRFEVEAQVIARLEHLHIVPLYDFWREPNNAYLVMRWMRSGSLRASLSQRGPWTMDAVARLLDQIASALTVAHRNLIVHRDLKPDNILLDEDANAYLADFGIAKDIHPDVQDEVQDSIGSPPYMAPEQFLVQPVSPQTDIYSLGIVVYELLTGRVPFDAETVVALAYHHVQEPIPSLQDHQPHLPTALNPVLWRATAKQPEARYPDVLAFAHAFRQAAADHIVQPRANPTAMTNGMLDGEPTLKLDMPLGIQNPYKGLRAFDEGDAADFFGRETFIKQLLRRLRAQEPTQRFLALVGPSGSGKSSLLRAGLLPALRRGGLPGSQQWFYSQIVPGASPLDNLIEALLAIAPHSPHDLAKQLRKDTHGLVNVVQAILPEDETEYCLLIDQFEEVFTLVENEAERRWFLDSLQVAVTHANSRLRVLITLRADFYDRPLLYAGFSELMRTSTEVVIPLQAEELEYAVMGPAQRAYLQFEPGLVGRIIADVIAQPGSLPLLQYALTELFERRRELQLTNAAYEAIEGVTGALAQRTETLYVSLASEAQAAAEKLLLRLVTVNDDGVPTRRRVLQANLLTQVEEAAAMRQVMETFGRYRLLTFDHDPITRAPTVELAHEALLSSWTRLKAWITANTERFRIQRELNSASLEWERSGRERSFLVTGARLARFESLKTDTDLVLSAIEQEYLDAAIALRQRGIQRLRLFIAALIAALIFALGLVFFAFQQRAEADTARILADTEAKLSQSRELAATALTHLDELDLSLLLSLEALNVADTFEARNSLITGLQSQPMIKTFFPDTNSVRAVTFSPDGRLLAVAGKSNEVRLWDVDTRQLVSPLLTGHTDWVNSLAFSPNGARVASASADGTVRVWDVTGQQVFEPLQDAQTGLWAVAFSPDGNLIAAAGDDGRLWVWNLATGQLQFEPLPGHEDVTYALAFSPDGQTLASGSADTTVRLWDVTGGTLLATFSDHNNWVLSLAFSPNGQQLASSGADPQIIIRDLSTDEIVAATASEHTNYIRSLAYSADGQMLASASQDGTVRLWDTSNYSLLQAPLSPQQGEIWSVAFRSSTHELATGAVDGKVILWNLDAQQALLGTHIAASAPITSLTLAGEHLIYSSSNATTEDHENTGIHIWNIAQNQEDAVFTAPQGVITDLDYNALTNRLAASSTDGTLLLWNMEALQPAEMPLVQASSSISTIDFSPDGRWLASGDEQGAVILWEVATGSPARQPLIGHEDAVLSVTFAPIQPLLASASRDGTIRLWTLEDPATSIATLTGHEDVVSSVVFSPDGRFLASGSYDDTVRLWDAETYQPVGLPLETESQIRSVAFSPDGQIVAAAGNAGVISLWDVKTGQLLGSPLLAHLDWITQLAFNSTGTLLASGGLDAEAHLWDFGLEGWATRACIIANRQLTTSEWARYIGSELVQNTCR